MEKNLQQKIAVVRKLPLKSIDTGDACLIRLFSQLFPLHSPYGFLHPAGIKKGKLPGLRNPAEVFPQKGLADFLPRGRAFCGHLIKARIQLSDGAADQSAFAGGSPTLQQHNHRKFVVFELDLQG